MDESLKPPIYSIEKFKRLKTALNEIQRRVMERDEDFEETTKLQTDLKEQRDYLMKKYDKPDGYAMFHIFGGSDIDEKIVKLAAEDFPKSPVDDSVESFIEILAKTYK